MVRLEGWAAVVPLNVDGNQVAAILDIVSSTDRLDCSLLARYSCDFIKLDDDRYTRRPTQLWGDVNLSMFLLGHVHMKQPMMPDLG